MHHSWAGGTSRQGREVSLAMLFFPLSLEHPVPGFQQPNEGGIWPVLLMCSACSAVLAVARFLISFAGARFSSALCLADGAGKSACFPHGHASARPQPSGTQITSHD